ncbi:hypothetical protein ADEAN_000084100 [Angomonas deanei]|uniref:Uncharacterized protein n=1 Tax=Angomonas deanei TaxID=59799 RepID=A0A7G2C104_9TRYP|nr:hypothetical protein ADEAN_000084100 [Angomonas deanei]
MQSPPSPRYAHARQPSSFDLARPLALTVNSVKALKSSFSPSGDFLGASRNPVLGDRGSKADKDGNAGVLSDESDDDRHEQRAQRYVEEFLQGADQMDQTISVESVPADGNERNEIERSIEKGAP